MPVENMLRLCLLILGSLFIFFHFIFYQAIPDPPAGLGPTTTGSHTAVTSAGHNSRGVQFLADRLSVDPDVSGWATLWSIAELEYRGFVLNFQFTETKISIKIAKHGRRNSQLYVEEGEESGRQRTRIHSEVSLGRGKVFLFVVLVENHCHWSRVPYKFQTHS